MHNPQCFPGDLGCSSLVEALPGFGGSGGWCRAQPRAWTLGDTAEHRGGRFITGFAWRCGAAVTAF